MKSLPDSIIQIAKRMYTKYNVFASVQIAQWMDESNFGADMPKGSNNPFGIKAIAGQPYVIAQTVEQHSDGSIEQTHALFRRFSSIEAAFDAHANLLANGKPYQSIKKYLNTDPLTYIEHMAPIYATSLIYAEALKSFVKEYNLTQYDVKIVDNVTPVAIGTATVIATSVAIAVSHVPVHHFNYEPFLFGGFGIIGGICISNIVGYFIAKHLHNKRALVPASDVAVQQSSGLTQEEIDMAIRTTMEPVIAAIAAQAQQSAIVTASEAALQQSNTDLTNQLATANQTIASMTQDDSDTDAAVANAANVNLDGTPKTAAS